MSWRGVWEESGRRLRRRRRWSGDVPEREISHSGRATRSHAPRCQHSPSALFTSRPYLSLHLRTSVPLSLSLTRPSPFPGLGPGSPSPLQPDAPTTAQAGPSATGTQSWRAAGTRQRQGLLSRGGSGWRGSQGTPCPPARSLTYLASTCQSPDPYLPTPIPTRVAEVCKLQPQPALGKRLGLPGLTSQRRVQVPDSPRLPTPAPRGASGANQESWRPVWE